MSKDTATHFAASSNRTLHRVTERAYKRGPEWQHHAGDTICGLPVDNGGLWSWDIQGHVSARDFDRACFFCFSGGSVPVEAVYA